jgi:RNA polymerase sigma factor (sigma-70 family)
VGGRQLTDVLRHLKQIGDRQGDLALPDTRLLERFARHRDETAFTALVVRHGPMVLGVCRRLLRQETDVEDAFQATFLILVRRAGDIARPGLLNNWLYGVAYRVASRVRKISRRQAGEPVDMAELPASEGGDPELAWLLHDEIGRLPNKYRDPVILCYLQGKTDEEAADQLCWPVGTVKGRLHRARALLRSRLARQELALSAGLLTTATASALPPSLLDSTIRAASSFAAGDAAAGGMASLHAVALTKGVLHAMLWTKLKGPALVALFFAVLGLTMGLGWHTAAADPGARRPKTRLAFRDKPGEKARSDKELLQGKWTATSVEVEGKDVSDDDGDGGGFKNATWEFIGDKIKVKAGDKFINFAMKLDPAAKPKHIDLNVEDASEADEKGKSMKGLYVLVGDTLKICSPIPIGGDRPAEVATREGSRSMLIVFKRQKPDEKKKEEKPAEKKKDEAARARDDKELLQGKWTVTAIEVDGKDVSSEGSEFTDSTWEFAGDRVKLTSGEQVVDFAVKVDPTAKPKHIDLDPEGKPIKGIYALDGDTLKICASFSVDRDRPAAFETKEGSEMLLLVFKRETK